MNVKVWAVVALLAFAVLGVASASCGQNDRIPSPTTRTIFMTAVEYKGSTEVAKEPFPQTRVEGAGYVLKEPKDGKWETSTYRFEPGTVIVYQGDAVELRIWGVNGAEHPSSIEHYVPGFNVKRGQLTTLSFKADQAGVFSIVCEAHLPSMQSTFVVLPRR